MRKRHNSIGSLHVGHLCTQERSILKGVELLSTAGIREEWQKCRKKIINYKIDVTTFLVWFVENWPESYKIMKAPPITNTILNNGFYYPNLY